MGAALLEHKYSEAAVETALRPSRTALSGIALVGAATLVLIVATPGPAAARILLATWVACAALEAIHSVALHRGRRGVRALLVRRSRAIDVESGSGAWRAGIVCDGSFVAPWLTVIRWRPHGARFARTIAILPDMLGGESFRRLRVLLRWA